MPGAHIAEAARDVAATLAILIGGCWALWKWSYGEKLRKRREMASPDGTLSATCEILDGERVAVTLHALWRNRGPLAIELCPQHTRVELFEIVESGRLGRLQLGIDKNSRCLSVATPTWSVYVMEPNTESVMHEHFILQGGTLYGFRWIICMVPGSIPGAHRDSHLVCTRELLWRADISVREGSCGSEGFV